MKQLELPKDQLFIHDDDCVHVDQAKCSRIVARINQILPNQLAKANQSSFNGADEKKFKKEKTMPPSRSNTLPRRHKRGPRFTKS